MLEITKADRDELVKVLDKIGLLPDCDGFGDVVIKFENGEIVRANTLDSRKVKIVKSAPTGLPA